MQHRPVVGIDRTASRRFTLKLHNFKVQSLQSLVRCIYTKLNAENKKMTFLKVQVTARLNVRARAVGGLCLFTENAKGLCTLAMLQSR